MTPDIGWQVQAAEWAIVWIAAGLAAREALARGEERKRRNSGRHE